MPTDLFTKELTKKDLLLCFIRDRRWLHSHEVVQWGLDNHYIRAERTARDLAQEGRIRRMSDELAKLRFGKSREEVWEFVR